MANALPDTKPFASFERKLAGRYLRSRRRDGFVSVISLFSFIGIMLGVATLIVVMAVFNGFREELLDKILGFGGHATVMNYDASPITDYEALRGALTAVDGVVSVTPFVEGQAMASSARSNTVALVRGMSEADLESLKSFNNSELRTALKDAGTPDETPSITGFDKSEGIAVGQGLAFKHNLSLGSTLSIISPDGPDTVMGTAPITRDYQVVAIFKIGMSLYDDGVIYMPLAEAQDFFGVDGGVSALEMMVRDPDKVDRMMPAFVEAAGPERTVQTWKGKNVAFFTVLNVERNMMFLVLSMIILVAALNIVSGLTMLVKDKGRDIGILRTMGATKGAIQRVFFLTGAAIGTTGTLAGFLLGLAICLNVERIRQFIGWLSGTEIFDDAFYYLAELPAVMDPWQTGFIVLMSLVISFLATLYPSWRAAKLDPVEALRYE